MSKIQICWGGGGGGDKNDCLLYKITPKNAMNFLHLFSCDTVEYWVYPEDF